MLKENLSFQEAVKTILPDYDKKEISHKPQDLSINSYQLLMDVADHYHKSFLEDKRGQQYLEKRGIRSIETLKAFKVGFVNGSLKQKISSHHIPDLKEIGILNNKGNESLFGCIVIPLYDDDQNIVGLYGRNTRDKRHLYLKGSHRGLFNRQGARSTKSLILTESILDALSLYELGIRNVTAAFGTGGFTPLHSNLIQEERIKDVLFAFDNDESGKNGSERIGLELKAMGVLSKRIIWPDEIKDANDFLTAGKTKEDFLSLSQEILNTSPDDYTIKKENNAIYLKEGIKEYRVRISSGEYIRHMRVNIKLNVGEASHIDIVDLYSQRSRKQYAKRVMREFGINENETHKDLMRIVDEIERTQIKEDPDETKKPYEMRDDERNEAIRSLKNPAFIKEIIDDLGRIGCVGEDINKLLGYMVTVSRRLEWPLSLIIVSQSGAGKSNLADTLESIVPPEECVHLSRITPQALYYMDRCALKRKVLIIEEKEGREAADYSIRVLQSKKALRLAVPIKDPNTGKTKTVTFEVEGPVVIIETTTKTNINPENASRCFISYMDESEDQTRRIQNYQGFMRTIDGVNKKTMIDQIKLKHQNIQRLLKPINIINPFISRIKFPTKWMRTRRDYPKFLNLIEVVAFLHQYQRDIKKAHDGTEYIESTLDDYRIAYDMARDVLQESLSELLKPEKDLRDKIQQLVNEKNLKAVTRRQIRDYTGLPDHVLRRLVKTLVDLEYLLVIEGKNGLKYEYAINPDPDESKEIIQGLTTPKELERQVACNLAATLRKPCREVNTLL
jgi:hypothetical protein